MYNVLLLVTGIVYVEEKYTLKPLRNLSFKRSGICFTMLIQHDLVGRNVNWFMINMYLFNLYLRTWRPGFNIKVKQVVLPCLLVMIVNYGGLEETKMSMAGALLIKSLFLPGCMVIYETLILFTHVFFQSPRLSSLYLHFVELNICAGLGFLFR